MRTVCFNGVTGTVNKAESVNKCFDEDTVSYDDYVSYYVSKKTYNHNEEGLNFRYKYVIRVEDLEEMVADDSFRGKIGVTLFFVPIDLCESVKASIMQTTGIQDASDILPSDIIMEGLVADFGSEIIENCRSLKGSKVKECLNSIATLLNTFDNLRGFYLDKTINMIGTTGWDMIRNAVLGESWTDTTYKRFTA